VKLDKRLIPVIILLVFLSFNVFIVYSVSLSDSRKTYKQLFYSGVELSDRGIRFTDQEIKSEFYDFNKFVQIKDLVSKDRDFNELVTFVSPYTGAYYQVYVAIHLQQDGTYIIRVQRSDQEGSGGIEPEWYKNTHKP
jgi:hypothetical protein